MFDLKKNDVNDNYIIFSEKKIIYFVYKYLLLFNSNKKTKNSQAKK